MVAQGSLSGNLETRAQFFIRDTVIGAANTPQYDHQLYGAEAWLSIIYRNRGFTVGGRFDVFHNTNLFNPQGSYSGQGLGRWFANKKVGKLDITAGYFYDQIGSGIIFRAYEERALGIDNALSGLKLDYDLHENWTIRLFTGKQKNRFSLYNPIVRGAALDGYMNLGKLSLTPGIGIVGKTLDDVTMNALVSTLNTYREVDQFIPKYNTYAYTLYNTLYAGNLSWYAEVALKSKDAMSDPFLIREDQQGNLISGNTFVQKRGSVLYTSLNYAQKGLGISLELKRTDHFNFRIRPQEIASNGLMNFLPPMTAQNTYRLTTLYTAATQELGEFAAQFEIRKKINDFWNASFHVSYIEDLDGLKLYNEWKVQSIYAKPSDYRFLIGLQLQNYNQDVYELKPGVPRIKTITPYLEYLKYLSNNRSIRIESQLMLSQQDRGSWMNLLAEYGLAPHWLITISNLFNLGIDGETGAHYYNAGVVYQSAGNRFSVAYNRQVEGIVCAGGICRFEPAFNGVRFTVITSF